MKLPNASASAFFSHFSNVRDKLFDLILTEILALRRIAASVRAVADGAFGLKEGCGVVSRSVDHLRLSRKQKPGDYCRRRQCRNCQLHYCDREFHDFFLLSRG